MATVSVGALVLIFWVLGAMFGSVRVQQRLLRRGTGGALLHRGLHIRHPGVPLDQERACEVLDLVLAAMAKRGHRPRELAVLLARIEVRIFPGRGPQAARIDVDARWAGWRGNRGQVLIRRDADWPDRLGRAILALLLMELEPGVKPNDVPVNVTDEAQADG